MLLQQRIATCANQYAPTDLSQNKCTACPLPGELCTPITLDFGQTSQIGIKLGTPNCQMRWSNDKYFSPVALFGNKVFHLKLVNHIKYNYFTLLCYLITL